MKVLIANWVYNWGSTGYICRDLKNELIKQGHQVRIASGFDWGKPKSGEFVFCTLLERIIYVMLNKWGNSLFYGSPRSTYKLIKFIKKEKPDIVHIHILNNMCCNMYAILEWLGKNGIKTVITHHAEFYYTGSCGHAYDCTQWIDKECRQCERIVKATGSILWGNPNKLWKRMAKTFSSFHYDNIYLTAVSPWVEKRSKQSPYLKNYRCKTVFNGIDTSIFFRNICLAENIKQTIGTSDYLLYISANFNPIDRRDIKGGYYIVELAKQMPDMHFLVVATAFSNIENLPSNVHFWGRAKSQQELAQLYSCASLTVLTSLKETFSMICAESLACGTPVVGFLAGGPETISIPQYSKFVENGNLQLLKKVINDFIGVEYDRDKIAAESQCIYSKEQMAHNYLNIYKELAINNE